jgi:hypothetical protein
MIVMSIPHIRCTSASTAATGFLWPQPCTCSPLLKPQTTYTGSRGSVGTQIHKISGNIWDESGCSVHKYHGYGLPLILHSSHMNKSQFLSLSHNHPHLHLTVSNPLPHPRFQAHNLYSLHPKLLECFDWNTNIKESMRNLWKRPTRI